MAEAPLGIDPRLWELLVCPGPEHGTLRADEGELVCTACGSRFPVRDGIPVMLLDATED